MPVHLYGQCADMTALNELAKADSLDVVEDAAQAFGALWDGHPAGSLGDAAAFSFYPTKNLSAFGDAGLLTTSHPQLAAHARSLRAHGMTRRYYHDEVGWNSRLDAIQAAVLEVKLRYVPQWNQQRRDRAARYDHLFREAGLAAPSRNQTAPLAPPANQAAEVAPPAHETSLVVGWERGASAPRMEPAEPVGFSPGPPAPPSTTVSTEDGIVLPYTDPRATHVFHQYVIRAPRRDALRDYLTTRGIGSEIYYPVPLHLQAALKDLGYKPGDFPHAERAAAEVLALPIFPELREDEQRTVVDTIRRFYA
jgi:dTDP-4-amino-4,6-dideoxygalactose transaminase